MSATGKKRDAQEVSQTILQTARSLFAEHGVDAVSMHQVAKAAQIGQGTLYRRYTNKSDLCMDIMKDDFLHFCESIDTMLQQNAQYSAEERMKMIARRIFAYLDEKVSWISVIQIPRNCESDKTFFFNSPPYKYLSGTYQSLLQEAQQNGQLREIDIAFSAHCLISCNPPESYLYLKKHMGYTTEQIADRFCQTFIDPLFITN